MSLCSSCWWFHSQFGLALQADKSRVKDYIHRLDNFDGPAVGEIAAGYDMFEEAFEIYKKFNLKTQAIKVLLEQVDDVERAKEYATKVKELSGCTIVFLAPQISRNTL